jgi:hypothetical protein
MPFKFTPQGSNRVGLFWVTKEGWSSFMLRTPGIGIEDRSSKRRYLAVSGRRMNRLPDFMEAPVWDLAICKGLVELAWMAEFWVESDIRDRF